MVKLFSLCKVIIYSHFKFCEGNLACMELVQNIVNIVNCLHIVNIVQLNMYIYCFTHRQ